MTIRIIETVNYDVRDYAPGLHEVVDADAQAIFARGSARPATVDEIETASDAPAPETAARKPATGGKAAAAKPAPAATA